LGCGSAAQGVEVVTVVNQGEFVGEFREEAATLVNHCIADERYGGVVCHAVHLPHGVAPVAGKVFGYAEMVEADNGDGAAAQCGVECGVEIDNGIVGGNQALQTS
jgi:hypothetical protein